MARDEYKIMNDALAAQPPVLFNGVLYDADYEYRRAASAARQRTGKSPGATEAGFVDRLIERRYQGDGFLARRGPRGTGPRELALRSHHLGHLHP